MRPVAEMSDAEVLAARQGRWFPAHLRIADMRQELLAQEKYQAQLAQKKEA